MNILIEFEDNSLVFDSSKIYLVGRERSCDIQLKNPKVSRTHAKISEINGSWFFEDLDSANGSFINKKQIHNVLIKNNSSIKLGAIDGVELFFKVIESQSDENKTIKIEYDKTKFSNKPVDSYSSTGINRIRLKQKILIGRHSENNWVIQDVNVSRYHAEIIQNDQGEFYILDLKSTNGTFLNNKPVKKDLLKIGDEIRIGSEVRKFQPNGLELSEGISGLPINVREVGFTIGDRILLENISFNLGPRTLTAIIGPSGAGKSTLLGVLTGRTQPTVGEVYFGDLNLNEHFGALSNQIGFVPQSDIIHSLLTVEQALSYGASLRLPSDTPKKDRDVRVVEVMDKLELTPRAKLRIDKLSGGQRKRASIGLELLTAPSLLALDEPTSGLDPGLDSHVMESLRSLADEGQTVILVTHSVDNLNYCDNVILMASGGKIAFCGPASSVFSYLKKKSWSEVFKFLASDEALNFAQTQNQLSFSTEQKYKHTVKKNRSFFKHLNTLSQRYIKVILADRFYSTLLIAIPIVMGFIANIAAGKYGFGPGKINRLGFYYNPFAQGTITLLILGSIFIGLATGIQEIVKENLIRKREQSVGIKPISYLLSKALVLGVVVFVQANIFVLIALYNKPLPKSGKFFSNSLLEISCICTLLAICFVSLGLLVSSIMTSVEQTMPALIGLTMLQIILSGALPLQAGEVVENLSKFMPSFWATNALSASVDIVQLTLVSDENIQIKWESNPANFLNGLFLISIFTLVFYLCTLIKLKRSR